MVKASIDNAPHILDDLKRYPTDGHEENLSFSEVAPVDVAVRKLTVQAYPSSPKRWFKRFPPEDEESLKSQTILNGLDSIFPRSNLTGIIGSSGSGKTTLLNILSHRMKGTNLLIRGQLLYNDSPSLSSVTYAYVTQSDVFLPTLTDLRLPDSISHEKRRSLVEEIILELGLKECADTLVGDGVTRKGCSGGERRRLSVGVQLLGNPSILFLDEPTTGLDATSAYQLVKMLKSLAKKGRTIIMTLHQPRSEVFLLLDAVTLLARGQSLYAGPVVDAVPWFEHRLPSPGVHVNPADYLINIAAIDSRTRETEVAGRARVNMLIAVWREESTMRFPDINPAIVPSCYPPGFVHDHPKVSFTRIVRALVSRELKSNMRDKWGVIASWIEAVLMGLVVGLVFLQLPDSMAGIRSRQAALYVSVGFQGYLVFTYEVYRLTSTDMPLFDREHGEGVVGVLPWIVSRRITHSILEDIIVPFVFSGISYVMIGLAPSAARFFYYFIVVLLMHYASLMFAGLSVAISRDFALSTLITNLAFAVHTHVCGFFLQADSIPVYLRWTKWISHLFYGFTALIDNEFKDRNFDCPLGDTYSSPDCNTYRGDFIIESLAVPHQNWSTIPIVAILGFIVFYSVAQILLLHSFTINTTILNRAGYSSNQRIEETHFNIKSSPRTITVGIEVDLEDYSLRVRIRGRKYLSIIQRVNTRFEPGKINVILGPSGSGKSSLLNLMAHRLQATSSTTYAADGEMKLNGVSATQERIRALCSYVTQDDTSLLPYLTVRETLEFAATLRLPSWMSKKHKYQKADEVMKKMGLKGCADTLVGNDVLKGISGGEKRRVSIAIQVLTDPQVLMLDEPTSGLDSFTAASIMDVLGQLADEGRTIITVLHQSSSELFEHFGNILLLAKGGRVAYSGPAGRMLEYMQSVGLWCPPTMNLADFALDVVSVDLREAEQEELSREKVDMLVEAFRDGEHRTLNEETKTGQLRIETMGVEKKMTPITTSLPILLKRGALAFSRRSGIVQARFGNAVGLGIVSALFFSPLGHDYISIQNRIGCIQGILPIYFVGILQNMAVYPMERDIFYQEHNDDAYSVESFFLAYTILELPLEVVACFTFSALAAIATNLLRTVDMFLVVTLNALCMVNAGESLGIIFNTIFHKNAGLALNVANVILCVMMFMAGLMSADMPALLQDIDKVSPLGYVIRNIMPLAFGGQEFTCDDDQRLSDGSCAISVGEQVLEMYHVDGDAGPLNLGAVVATMVVYRFLAYIVVKVAKAKFGGIANRHCT
ncbi:P-loop containing nucleoside triphosphate hydrolase protein [Desarmillaria tabescens]|uniref:P-loop containing nucleoside triphosphate hydrolase protein n=1 Tax=Armillaria tabescens TaxID=1929756 RepID=A0AA39MXJ0_ARMTA|nr:P-loop containing nucleoside triphosphate hydrolase protein [Desarmillaria tabescens]KAK0450317.1 P-loop containing nucleoside triphosphate hydrolase protein [Desarmillaria tabescens]